MSDICIERIVAGLKEIIDRNGPACITDEPYTVYLELLELKAVDRKTASAILYLMASRIVTIIEFAHDSTEEVSEIIRRECSLNKRMADRLSIIMTALYSNSHRKEWKEMEREGLRQFLKEEFTHKWEGFAVWDAGNGTVDCHYEAEIILTPTEEITKDKELIRKLKNNSFMTKEAIHDLFAKRLREKLDYEFEYYCTCDDYYQPVVEDFGTNLECLLHNKITQSCKAKMDNVACPNWTKLQACPKDSSERCCA